MSPRTCLVSFVDPSGIRHTAEVTADSLYEAAALGISRLKRDGWTEALGVATSLDIEVREPSVRHSITVKQIQKWAEATAVTLPHTPAKDRLNNHHAPL